MNGVSKNKCVRRVVKDGVSTPFDNKQLSYDWCSVLTLFLVFYFETVYISKETFL